MKKRLIAFLTSIILLLSSLGAVQAYPGDSAFLGLEGLVSDSQESDVLCKLLVSLGLLSYDTTNFIGTEAADYGDFISALAVMEYMDTSLSIGDLYEKLQVAKIVKEGEFPSTLIMTDVIYSMVRLTGFWQYAEYKGGEPTDYVMVAQSNDLLRNLAVQQTTPVTKGELVQLLYNMLSVPSNVVTGVIADVAVYEQGTPATLLERRFNVEMVQGIVTASGASGLYGKSDLDADQGEIDRVVYETGSLNLRLNLGKSVVAFVQHDDAEPRGTILCLEASNRNQIITVNDENKGMVTQNCVEYFVGEKLKKAKLADDAAVVYNGVSLGVLSSVNLVERVNGSSSVELIDNDSDGTFEIVSIWAYQHFAVDSVTKNVVFLKYGMSFNGSKQLKLEPEEDEGYKVEAYKNGNIITETKEISANNVVSVAMSTNTYGEKLMIVQTSDKSITGKIGAIRNEGGRYFISVAEGEFGQTQEYPVSSDFAAVGGLDGKAVTDPDVVQPQVGMQAILVLTYDGYVADVRRVSASENYAYIIQVGTQGGALNKEGIVKLIDHSGNVHTYTFAEKVRYYDAAAMDGVMLDSVDVSAKIQARNSTDYRCLCIYKLNGDGQITELYTPVDNIGNVPGQLGYPLTLDYRAVQDDGNKANYYHGFFNEGEYSHYSALSNPLFVVPATENATNESLYSVQTQVYFGRHVRYSHIELYGCNRFYEAKVGVSQATVTSEPKYSEIPAIITKIGTVADEEEGELLQISYLQDGVSRSCAVKDMNLKTTGGFLENTPFTELAVGDIVQIGLSMDAKIESVRLMFRASDTTAPFGSTQGTAKGVSAPIYGHYLKVVDVKSDVMLGNYSPTGDDPASVKAYRLGNPNAQRSFGAALYTRSTGKAIAATTADLMIGDTVYLRSNYGFNIDMFIIRD